MQCVACRAVYSNALDACPRCKKLKTPALVAPEMEQSTGITHAEVKVVPSIDSVGDVPAVQTSVEASTLIAFPRAGRSAAHPPWRKELSERVREIQLKRAREAALEAEQAALCEAAPPLNEPSAAAEGEETPLPLGLVPPRNDAPPLNPLVAAALRRIERARQPRPASSPSPLSVPRAPASSSGGGAAIAVARVVKERYQPETDRVIAPDRTILEPRPATATEFVSAPVEKPDKPTDTVRTSSLVAVRPSPSTKPVPPTPPIKDESSTTPARAVHNHQKPDLIAPPTHAPPTAFTHTVEAVAEIVTEPVQSKPVPRRVVAEVIDDAVLERREAERQAATAKSVGEDDIDRAPLVSRVVGSIIDLIAISLLASPFAAIIELTNGNWTDLRVAASMGGIFVIIMFLYLTGSVALAGRTWGMSLVSLRPVDANTALAPTIGQCIRRSLVYMLSLAAFGLGLLYAILDPSGRAAHDRLSGTTVIRD